MDAMHSDYDSEFGDTEEVGSRRRFTKLTYPDGYCHDVTTKGGIDVRIRPICPGDRQGLRRLFEMLSRSTAELRFGSRRVDLSPGLLVQHITLDQTQNIALAATGRGRLEGQILGTARVVTMPGGETGELALLVGDVWQGKGIGATLFSSCLEIASKRGLAMVWCIVPQTNTVMLQMARSRGFIVRPSRFTEDYDVIVLL